MLASSAAPLGSEDAAAHVEFEGCSDGDVQASPMLTSIARTTVRAMRAPRGGALSAAAAAAAGDDGGGGGDGGDPLGSVAVRGRGSAAVLPSLF